MWTAAKGKPVTLSPRDTTTQSTIESSRLIIEALTNSPIAANTINAEKPADSATALLPGGEVQIYIGGIIDKSTESAKLTKRKAELEKLLPPIKAKLSNEAAIAKVPSAIAQGWRDQITKYEEELAALETNLKELSA